MAQDIAWEDSVQWTGLNFPEIYGWLIEKSKSKDLALRVLDPGNPSSTIEIENDGLILQLNIGDRITRDLDGLYFVEKIED